MKNFEVKVINPILRLIRDKQEFLTQPENLPMLAKLGYMYNTLWYAGRVAYGCNGVLGNYAQCENNPKYKIEMCDGKTDKIDNLIYDAWGMHVSNNLSISWDEFYGIVYKGKELSKSQVKQLKLNKTFDEWVEILSDESYEYSSLYPDRKSVANHLLCVIGNGYGYKNGYVIREASGADEDIAQYGDWRNAKFTPAIQKLVDKIMSIPETKLAVDAHYKITSEYISEKEAKELEQDIKVFGMPYKEYLKSDEYMKVCKAINKKYYIHKPTYSAYYPISNYSIISKFDKHTDVSYINAGIEICKEILAHSKQEEKENVKFAEKFLKKFDKVKAVVLN